MNGIISVVKKEWKLAYDSFWGVYNKTQQLSGLSNLNNIF